MSCDGERSDSLDVLLVANKRKPNFTEGESLFLISQFERNSGVLTSKLNDASTNKQKVEVWKRICSDYNSRNPIILRTADDLKRKWKNMVRAAKKELLESSAHPESSEQSLATRKFSLVSQRIIEILRITVAGPPEEPAGINFDDGNADESTFFEEEGEEKGEREINGEQHVVHIDVKTDGKPLIVSSATNTENTVKDSQKSANIEPSLSALSSQTLSAEEQKTTPKQVSNSNRLVPSSHGNGQFATASAVPMTVLSSMSEIREIPRVIATKASSRGRHRLVVPQHKRIFSSPITHALKKRKCCDYADESFGTHVRAEINKLKKEKLMLEKEKLALENEKLVMEQEKLGLEIQFLRDQMDDTVCL